MILLAIELGDININNASSNSEIIWFAAGLLTLIGVTTALIWWQRRSKPDPFAE